VLVLPQKELMRVVEGNPFPEADVKSLYVVFLFEPVKKSEFEKLKMPLQSGRGQFWSRRQYISVCRMVRQNQSE